MDQEKVNRTFIVSRLTENGRTMKDLAYGMELDPTSLSKRVNGKREFSAKELVQLAQFLDIPIDQALQQIGISAPTPSDHAIPLIGFINEKLVLELAQGEPKKMTDVLHHNRSAVAYEFKTGMSEDMKVQMMAGVRLVTLPFDGISPECLGRLSIALEKDTNRVFIGRMSRSGSSAGYFIQGEVPSQGEVAISAASPVLAMFY